MALDYAPGRTTRPRVLKPASLAYTPEALKARVEGPMTVRCIVDVDGSMRLCKVLQSLPFMDEAVVRALEASRYEPAIRHGNAIVVDYTFRLHFILPR